ncbi:MAG: energy-coupling factor transporter transmembrane protein EcfT [Lachnospiraceae bacterium]|nr:energy-coupling factor transporter transmembrane protein EcfT [Lachnospiraceae bacterium]
MKQIRIGQYYPAESLIHKLDPRVKLLALILYLVLLFLQMDVAFYGLMTCSVILVWGLSDIPASLMSKTLRKVIPLLIFTSLFVLLTEDGLVGSMQLFVRLVLTVISSTSLVLTTTPNDLADGIAKALRPLNKIGVPVAELSLILSIVFRFIPIFMEELDKIRKAQMARGVDFGEGNLIEKAQKLVPILVPLFVSSIRRANELATAMEARCYQGGEKRTKMKPLQYQYRDYVAYAIILCYFIFGIIVKIGA